MKITINSIINFHIKLFLYFIFFQIKNFQKYNLEEKRTNKFRAT